MRSARNDKRFFATTRGRLIRLLRRASRTVDELARELGLTDNAIRAHLVALERDRLVERHGQRPSGGKPAFTYRLTPEAESLFPKAYAQILCRVLAQVAARHGRAELETVLRAVGQELANALDTRLRGETLGDRLEVAQKVWGDLGGLAEVRRQGDQLLLEALSCPLKEIVLEYPEGCQLAQALLQSVLDTAVVYEHCVRDTEPRCIFEIVAG